MANSLDNFKPAGGVQIRAHELSGPVLPGGGMKIGPMGQQYVQPILQAAPQQQQVVQQPVQGGNGMFGGGPQNAPKGAQPVRLAGATQHDQMGNAPRLPMAPGHPAPKPQAQGDGEVHVIRVEGKGLDGKTYIAEFEALFPRGTRVLGATDITQD